MATLPFPPDKANYLTTAEQDAVISIKLAGGLSATRLDQLGASSMVTVTWTLSSADYTTLYAFWRDDCGRGSLPFEAPLEIEGGALADYDCKFVVNSFGIQSRMGDTFVVGAVIEAVLAA